MFKILPTKTPCSRNLINLAVQEKWCDIAERSRMGVSGITRAVLLAVNTAPTNATYDAVYGGEPLLTRALVALSKTGIRSVWIICHEGHREKIAALIRTARARVALDYDISPIST